MYLFLCEFQSFIFSRGVFLAWTYAQSEIVAEIPEVTLSALGDSIQ